MASKPGRYVGPVDLPTQSCLFILNSLVEKVPAALHLQLQSKEITLLNFSKIYMPSCSGEKLHFNKAFAWFHIDA